MKVIYFGCTLINTPRDKRAKNVAVSMHIVDITEVGKKTKLPSKTFINDKGYTKDKGTHYPMGYEDIIFSINSKENYVEKFMEYIEDIDFNNTLVYINRDVSDKKVPSPDPLIGLVYVKEQYVEAFEKAGAIIVEDKMLQPIANDIELALGLELLRYGNKLRKSNTPADYWKDIKRDVHVLRETGYRISGSYNSMNYMSYGDEYLVGVENYEAYYKMFTTELTGVIRELSELIDMTFREKVSVLIVMNNVGIFSKQFSRLYRKFGMDCIYIKIDVYENVDINVCNYYSKVKKDMTNLKLCERRPRPVLDIVRMNEMERVRLVGEYIMTNKTDNRYNDISNIRYKEIEFDGNMNTRKLYNITETEKASFLPKIFDLNIINKFVGGRYFISLHDYKGDSFISMHIYKNGVMASASSADMPLYLNRSTDKRVDLIIKEHPKSVMDKIEEIENSFFNL